jgi:putative heme-binding domain-containing protein
MFTISLKIKLKIKVLTMMQSLLPATRRRASRSWALGPAAAWLFALGAALLPAVSFAQTINPLESDPRAAAAGGSLYRAQCATCHGADAMGIQDIQAPDLTRLWSTPGRSDAGVFQIIRNGIPGSIMPPHSYTDTETWMLVSYLKSIGGGGNPVSYAGNRQQGATLFARSCSRCHRVNGTGGSLGPDLSRITAQRSKQALQLSVRNPSDAMRRGFRPVRLVGSDYRQFRGTIKSEDAFTIQIMDTSQALRGFRKSDLVSIQYEERSLMPRFTESALSDSALEDILSYLASAAGQSTN